MLLQDYESLAPVERKCLNIHPGLSSYADTPELAGRSLKPLFDHAIELGVPTGSKVYLAATAGLRMLPDRSAVDKIMESARSERSPSMPLRLTSSVLTHCGCRMYLEDHYAPHLMWATHYPRVLSGNEEVRLLIPLPLVQLLFS